MLVKIHYCNEPERIVEGLEKLILTMKICFYFIRDLFFIGQIEIISAKQSLRVKLRIGMKS